MDILAELEKIMNTGGVNLFIDLYTKFKILKLIRSLSVRTFKE